MVNHQYSSGNFLVNFALLSICVGILAGVSLPALKHKNKREVYREITDSAFSITNTIEKCLGLERDSTLCDTPEKLIPYGFSAVDIELNPLISEASIKLDSNTQLNDFIKDLNNEGISTLRISEKTNIRIHELRKEVKIAAINFLTKRMKVKQGEHHAI